MSPVDPTILASVSIDCSLRIWSLHPSHEKQPLGAICYGQGHKEQVLTLVSDFPAHPTNLLTLAGISSQRPVHPYRWYGYKDLFGRGAPAFVYNRDSNVHQWAVPDDLKEYTGTDQPVKVHYPHFSTTEIHTDFIDW